MITEGLVKARGPARPHEAGLQGTMGSRGRPTGSDGITRTACKARWAHEDGLQGTEDGLQAATADEDGLQGSSSLSKRASTAARTTPLLLSGLEGLEGSEGLSERLKLHLGALRLLRRLLPHRFGHLHPPVPHRFSLPLPRLPLGSLLLRNLAARSLPRVSWREGGVGGWVSE